MHQLRYIAMPTETADRFRQTGLDDAGEALQRRRADSPSPCRHCLHDAAVGDGLLLGSYRFGRPFGAYWAPSPIWVHAHDCRRFDDGGAVPEIVRRRLVSLRAYDANDQMLYDLGHVCDGGEVDARLHLAFGDGRTDYVNIHTAGPGCFLCRVEPNSRSACDFDERRRPPTLVELQVLRDATYHPADRNGQRGERCGGSMRS